jgi:hypothetical protein
MTRKLVLTGIVALVGVTLNGSPKQQVKSQPPGNQAQSQASLSGDQSYSHDARGLEQEYEVILRAAGSGDSQQYSRQFAVFKLPEAADWFGQYFMKENVQQLGWDYEAEVPEYEKSLLNVMQRQPGVRFHVHCKATSREALTGLQPRTDAVRPSRPVPVEQFEVEFVGDGGRFSQLVNFAYVDSGYRYLGKGAYPFWSMPDEARSAPPK